MTLTLTVEPWWLLNHDWLEATTGSTMQLSPNNSNHSNLHWYKKRIMRLLFKTYQLLIWCILVLRNSFTTKSCVAGKREHYAKCTPRYIWRVIWPRRKYSLGNHKNYRKPKFQLFVHFLFIKTKTNTVKVEVLKIKLYAFNVSYNSRLLQTNQKSKSCSWTMHSNNSEIHSCFSYQSYQNELLGCLVV